MSRRGNDLARIGREEHEERENTRQKIRRLRGGKKPRTKPRSIRAHRAAENARKGQR